MADKVSKFIFPVKSGNTIADKEFDLPSGGESSANTFFGTCSTAADQQVKVVTIDDDTGFELRPGVIVFVKFTNTNTYSSTADNPIKLNINNTGDINIYYNNTVNQTGTSSTAFGYANRYNIYTYNGTHWIWSGSSVDNNTTYSSKAAVSGGTATSLCTTGEKYTWNNKASSDTKNTAGSTDTSSKIFLIGATSQAANPQTYSHDTAYVGADGCLYSDDKKVLTDLPNHNHDDRYYTEDEENQIIEALQSTIVDSIYPVGSLYMSINSTMPSILTTGKTWELLSGDYVLKTITTGTGGQTSNAGNTGSTTLTAAQSGVPAHSHGLNSHTHSVGAHSHGLNSHTHSIPALSGTAASNGVHTHSLRYANSSGSLSYDWNLSNQQSKAVWSSSTGEAGAHTHSVTTTKSTTGAASGSTANSSAFNTGAASGNTANNSAANASQGHAHTAGMPQNIGVYVWKRTA